MRRSFSALSEQSFDLLVIGGGAFGACAAWDATLRGLKVALVERTDFASGTSANSFKMVHGGIRYVQHLDIPRLRASCRERSALLRVAPHLVSPLPIVIPTYGHLRQGKAFLGTGMLLYDLLTADRNRSIRDQTRHIPPRRFLGRAEIQNLFPGIEADDLTGGAVFCDGQMYNPTRLVLAFVRSAVELGMVAANYAEAEELLRSADSIVGARVRDLETGEFTDVRARAVLNAAGPWVPWMLDQRQQLPLKQAGTYSRDACFLVQRQFPHSYALAVQGRTQDPDAVLSRAARHLFIVPWREFSLVGVWHVVWQEHPDSVSVTEAELTSFLGEINEAFPGMELTSDDVTMWNAGLVPFGENEPGAKHLSYGKRSHIIDHKREHGIDNLVSLIGVRYTMARGDAAKAVDMLCRKLEKRVPGCTTDRTPIFGGDFESFSELCSDVARCAPPGTPDRAFEPLAHNYGTQYRDIFALGGEDPELAQTVDESTTLRGEVIHAIRAEMAVHLSDIVFRRTDLGTGGHPGSVALRQVAQLAARELGWSDQTMLTELDDVERRFGVGVTLEPLSIARREPELEELA